MTQEQNIAKLEVSPGARAGLLAQFFADTDRDREITQDPDQRTALSISVHGTANVLLQQTEQQ